MAKFCGVVGYIWTHEKPDQPGVWTREVREVVYRGDILRMASNWQNDSKVNDDLIITNRISIVADAFAYTNFAHIKYVEWGCTKWTVKEATVDRPRIILSLGGVYNGEQA